VMAQAQWQIQQKLPFIDAALADLRDADDFTLVEVDAPGEHVQVSKSGSSITVDVDNADATVHVSPPSAPSPAPSTSSPTPARVPPHSSRNPQAVIPSEAEFRPTRDLLCPRISLSSNFRLPLSFAGVSPWSLFERGDLF
jgi:hypothetical protein